MKIIKPSVEFFDAVPTDYNAALKFIEMAGRTCYKSEDKITEDSAEGFVKKLIKAGHLAMVEHSNFVVRVNFANQANARLQGGKYLNEITLDKNKNTYIGGNLTAWYQRMCEVGIKGPFKTFVETYGQLFEIPTTIAGYSVGWNPDGRNWQVCPHDEIPKELHRYSAKFICDRGVSHELVRHRPASMDWISEFVDSPLDIYKVFDASLAQESTRYVNYAGKEMEFIEPTGFEEWLSKDQHFLIRYLDKAESEYDDMISYGFKPQQARAVLPNALKTEIIVTADAAEWEHIRKLRTHKSAHPDMIRIMNMMPWDKII